MELNDVECGGTMKQIFRGYEVDTMVDVKGGNEMATYSYTCYGETYDDCRFVTGRYPNQNLAVRLISDTQGPILTVTTNPGIDISDEYICIKDYSENEGVLDWIKSLGMIDPEATEYHQVGWAQVSVHKLTNKGKEILGLA